MHTLPAPENRPIVADVPRMPAVKVDYRGRGGDLEKPRRASDHPAPTPGALPRRLPATTDSSREAMLTRQQRLREDGYEIEQIAGRGPEIDPARAGRQHRGFRRLCPGAPGGCRPGADRRRGRLGRFFRAACDQRRHADCLHSSMRSTRSTAVVARARCAAASKSAVRRASSSRAWRRPASSRAGCRRGWRYCRRPPRQRRAIAACSKCAPASSATRSTWCFEFATGDAAGQNMVTKAAEAVCQRLLAETPVSSALVAHRVDALG